MFLIHTAEGGHVPSFEYFPCSAVPKVGLALKMDGGSLAVASAAEAPGYISMCERAEAPAEDELIPVIRASEGIVFETKCTVAFTDIKLGDKVNISADGAGVTATTGGPAEVVYIGGTEIGSVVRVRFTK